MLSIDLIGILLSGLIAGPSLLHIGLIAALFLDFVRVAMALILGAVPKEFVLAGAFTTVRWQQASALEAAVVLLSGPLILALWTGKRKGLLRLALFSLALGLWRFFGGGP